ncbi:STM3941 family protein [Chryseobacterium potabilaquae]|nr:STM3941 family protein [Chryseobacterium potabilaquae]
MNKIQNIEIKLSKKKLMFLLLLAIGFVIISSLFSINPSYFVSFITRSEKVIFLIGVLGTVVFGIASILLFIKLFDNKLGLVINKEGILDNTNFSSIGLIKWVDITNIRIEKVMSTKFLLIEVINPNEYIERASVIKKLSLKQNMKTYNTPITLTSVGLQHSFEDLSEIIFESWKKYKSQSI